MYTERVTVQRAPNPAGAASGAAERVYTTVITTFPMRITALRGSYRQQNYGMTQEANYIGYAPGRPDIRVGDRIVNGSAVYDVTFVSLEERHHIEIDLALVVVP